MSHNMRCPYNTGRACASDDRPISFDESDELYDCSGSPCAYIAELNYKVEAKNQAENIRQQLDWTRINIGATEDEDSPLSETLEFIRQQLDWIRENIGATDDGDGNIYDTSQDILKYLPTEESVNNIYGKLGEILNELHEINISTYRY